MNFNKHLSEVFIVTVLLQWAAGLHAVSVAEYQPYIPTDKGLDPAWVDSLTAKGQQRVYQGQELELIAMPCGGIGAGQVEVTGQGKICFTESVYNQMQQPNAGHGLSTGYQYLHPKKSETKIANSFSIVINEQGKEPQALKLNGDSFDDMRFIGEYPIAQLEYRKTGSPLPVAIDAEVFSPFVPLDVRSSANPVTVLRFSVTNNSLQAVDVTLAGWLKNVTFPEKAKVKQVNKVNKANGVTGISFEMQPIESTDELKKHAQLGGLSLSVLDDQAGFSVASATDTDYVQGLLTGHMSAPSGAQTHTSDEPIGGGISSRFSLKPKTSNTVTFLLTWCFPNGYENGRRYRDACKAAPGWVGHIYNNWYASAFDVAKYTAKHFESLYGQTKLFRYTYHDTTLPYWLANRITMPVSTLAAGNVAIWENRRMYAYEGVGFCMGTCGHVYNFVTAISKLFPELERSVRLQQDFCDTGDFSGYSQCGRINFRGYLANNPDVPHSYASDAQSGYVLKAYREHLMSPNNDFLDTVWDKVKGAIGYQIFKDGAEIGLPPNGVLEGKQTFWDPMWFGPNPYNNTLYLAALRAAEEMARIQGEPELAQRYRRLFESGRQYMNEHMWNGEYYVHLYPVGFKGNVGISNGFSKPAQVDTNAKGYVAGFNTGQPNYLVGTGCDAQQLFGQNWAHQLGLGDILPPERCRQAAASIFKYNWTPDIALVYNVHPPRYRTLAASGEGAMVNGAWPKAKRQRFENTHDKDDIWSGLEYEAACDMINAGLLKEALISLRAIHDRYDGLKRNPWNEIEGSDHYSRAMHAWNVLLALSGYTYDGPAGKIGFDPKITPEHFKSFFSAAEGWGTYEQKRTSKGQTAHLYLAYGQLQLKTLSFVLPDDLTIKDVDVTLASRNRVRSSFKQDGHRITLEFTKPVQITAGQTIQIAMR